MPDSFGLCGALIGVFAWFMVSAFILAPLGGTDGNEGDSDPDYPPPGTPPQGHARTAFPASRGNLAPAPLSGGRKRDAELEHALARRYFAVHPAAPNTASELSTGNSAKGPPQPWRVRYASWIPPPWLRKELRTN